MGINHFMVYLITNKKDKIIISFKCRNFCIFSNCFQFAGVSIPKRMEGIYPPNNLVAFPNKLKKKTAMEKIYIGQKLIKLLHFWVKRVSQKKKVEKML